MNERSRIAQQTDINPYREHGNCWERHATCHNTELGQQAVARMREVLFPRKMSRMRRKRARMVL